jgi:hypothetical protein
VFFSYQQKFAQVRDSGTLWFLDLHYIPWQHAPQANISKGKPASKLLRPITVPSDNSGCTPAFTQQRSSLPQGY